MPFRLTTRPSAPSADFDGKPILDICNALNLNVCDDGSAGLQSPRLPSEPQSFKSRDEAEEFLASTKP